MTRPTIQVRCAFANNPFVADSTLAWTDITSDVRIDPAQSGTPIVVRRGRQNELGRIEAGTLSLTLDNRSRQYDSEYTSSPYYPNVTPMKRIQLRAQAPISGTWYALWTGYVEAWAPEYPGPRDSVVRVRASDAFNAIARSTVSVTSLDPGELTHFAIRTALGIIGWPLSDYTYSSGLTRIPAGAYLNQNTLQYIQAIVEAENGLFFVGGDGLLRFQDRQWRVRNNGSYATFDPTSSYPYEALDLSYDQDLIYNDIQITRSGGTLQEAIDSASQANYGPRVLSKTGILLGTDNEALGLAQWELLRYKNPALRVVRLVLNGDLDSSGLFLWPHILGRDLSDKVTVVVRPPGGGTISKGARIEAISHTIGLDSWRTSWELSLAGEDQYWILQDSTLGVLDTTTKLAY